jgi:hypothetical protein
MRGAAADRRTPASASCGFDDVGGEDVSLTREWMRGLVCRSGCGAAALLLSWMTAGAAAAQDAPNPGALTFSAAVDVLPGVPYIFRGIVQESDPKLTIVPYANLGIELFSGQGGLKRVGLDVGVWHSLQTGSSGLASSTERLHYEEDFYATLSLGLPHSLGVAATYTAYTSPNGLFGTVQELALKVSSTDRLAPYGLIAFELAGTSDGSDSGIGTYLELGAGPSWPLGGVATITLPVTAGFSLKNYYQHPDGTGDARFGYVDVGGIVTVPLTAVPARFGSWGVHGGLALYLFGGTTKAFNGGDRGKVVGLFGVSVGY